MNLVLRTELKFKSFSAATASASAATASASASAATASASAASASAANKTWIFKRFYDGAMLAHYWLA